MSYPTDLTDVQWERVAPYFAQKPGSGRRRHIDTRAVVNAVLYRLRTGCPWRLLPREYPRWQVVYYHVSQWSGHGTLEQVQAAVREGVRQQQGCGRRPTTAIIDSQSAKGSNVADASTIDGGKKGQGAQAAPGR